MAIPTSPNSLSTAFSAPPSGEIVKTKKTNGLSFQNSGRVTNKELWQELQKLRTEFAVLATQYKNTATEVEEIKSKQNDFIRIAAENQVEHERILASIRNIGVRVGFWAVVSGAAVSIIWNSIVSPLLLV